MNTHVPLTDLELNDSATSGASTHGHWPAQLHLRFHRTAGNGCKLVHNRHEGPLVVQRPFYPEDGNLAHVYLLHPPGGLVSGDDLRIHLQLGEAAQVLCTTPGAGRLYRARSDKRLQQQHCLLEVAADASLEWFPLETLAFRGAHARLTTEVKLSGTARFCGWDLIALGHVANRVRFDDGELTQRFRVFHDDVPVLLEQLQLRGGNTAFADGAAGLRGNSVSGVFLCGPYPEPVLRQFDLIALQAALPAALQDCCGLTRVGTFVVGRYLGDSASDARDCFIRWWEVLRPSLLQRPACKPRIWTT
ncbi:MAG TPA: urease accessory protein UreD [Candidatus Acidoferrum sp.]|nr:urease accessory protein UreD [Candidatus Acidoferrum sp.]